MFIEAIKTLSRYSLSIIYNPKHKKVLIQTLNDVKHYLKSSKHGYIVLKHIWLPFLWIKLSAIVIILKIRTNCFRRIIMISKEELVDKIESTKLERKQDLGDSYEKRIYLDDDDVLIVGYSQEEKFEEDDPEEESVKNYYWYWELRNSQTWDLIFENQDKSYNFCESEVGGWSDNDRVEDVVGDIAEEDVCKWSEQDWIEDISEIIADEVISWIKTLGKD